MFSLICTVKILKTMTNDKKYYFNWSAMKVIS